MVSRMPEELTQHRLKELLHYDPKTGEWRRLHSHQRPDCTGRSPGYVNKRGRHMIAVGGREYQSHRLAFLYMTGEWPKGGVDHKDGIGHNNAWSNLRLANQSQNIANSKLSDANTSGFKGVHWGKSKKKWIAQITINGKCKCLGRFKDLDAARLAYEVAAREAFGEFSRTHNDSSTDCEVVRSG
jgi:hypothetical protein